MLIPDWLDELSAEYYRKFAPMLGEMTNADIELLTLLATSLKDYQAAQLDIEEEGQIVDSRWGRKENPACKIRDKCLANVCRVMAELRLSRASRAEVKAKVGKNPLDKMIEKVRDKKIKAGEL